MRGIWKIDGQYYEADSIRAMNAEIDALKAERDRLREAQRPKPLADAPKDRLIIGVERPPFEDDTFYYALHWSDANGLFMTVPLRAFNGATHYLDPLDLPGLDEDGDTALRTGADDA